MKFTEYEDPEELHHVQELLLMLIKELNRICDALHIQVFAYGGTAIGAVRHKGFIPWDDDADFGLLRKDYERFLSEAPALLGDQFEIVNNRINEDYPSNISILALKETYSVPDTFKKCKFQYPIRIDIFAFDNRISDEKLFRKQCRSAIIWGRLTFLRGTPRPYIAFNGLKEAIALAGCKIVHGLMILFNVSQRHICNKWEAIATKYNDAASDTVVDFSDMYPEKWQISYSELFPLKKMKFEDTSVFVPNDYDAVLKREYGNYMEIPPVEERKNHHPARLDFGSY